MKKTKIQYVMVCPKCKSPDTYRDTTNQLTGAFGMSSLYVCNKCEHSGYIFPEVDINSLEDFQKEVDKEELRDETKDNSNLLDPNYGKFIVGVFWKILGPIAMILGIIFMQGDYLSKVRGTTLLVMGAIITYYGYKKIK